VGVVGVVGVFGALGVGSSVLLQLARNNTDTIRIREKRFFIVVFIVFFFKFLVFIPHYTVISEKGFDFLKIYF
jgi:hypothetical protein